MAVAALTVEEIIVVQAGKGKKKPAWMRALKEEKIGKQVEIIVREE